MLTYTNAGHYLPMLVRADGSVERLGIGGPVLGVLRECRLRTGAGRDRRRRSTGALHRRPDRSARRARDEEFGEDRLLAAAVAHRACSAPALQARLADAVAAFTGGTLQDDATLMVLAADQG